MFTMKKAIAFMMAMIMMLTCIPISLATDGDNQVTDTLHYPDIRLIPKQGEEAETGEQPEETATEDAPEEQPGETAPEDAPEEQQVADQYTCTLPGAQDVSLSDVLGELEIAGEQEISSFMEGIESVSVSNPDSITLTETENDWTIRATKETEEPESVTICMQDGTEYGITAASEGNTEISTENNALVISTVNDMYLPEEANAYGETLTDEQGEAAISAVQEAAADEAQDQSAYQVLSIGLENVDETEYEGFEVSVNLGEDLTGKDFKLYQVQDGTATDITDTLQLTSETTENGLEAVSGFSFTTDGSAEYVLRYTLETTYTTFDGETFRITLNYETEAGIPDGAELKVREILQGGEEYDRYLSDSAAQLGVSSSNVSFARFFDIEIEKDGVRVEPKTPVQVTIAYQEAMELGENTQLSVVHFADEGTEVIRDVDVTADGMELTYEQGSFSVTGTIVTQPEDDKSYVLVIKHKDDKYYVVENDGTLTLLRDSQITISNGSIEEVELINPIFWRYQNAGNGQCYLWHNKDARTTGFAGLPKDYTRRYIDAAQYEGYIDKDDTADASDQSLRFVENHLFHGASYLGVTTSSSGKNIICGNCEPERAAIVYLVEAEKVKNVSDNELIRNHMVNHIDISVEGKATIKMPLAFGKYRLQEIDETTGEPIDGRYRAEPLVINESNNMIMVQQDVYIDENDLRKASITTSTRNSNGSKSNVNDAYIVTGYSKNTVESDDPLANKVGQIRLEGRFKVADLDPVLAEEQNSAETCARRLANRIYYDLSVTKPVTFLITYTDPATEKKYAVVKDNGTLFKVTVDVSLGTTFDFWDPDNECPGVTAIDNDHVWWSWENGTRIEPKGGIPENSWWSNYYEVDGGPGMDFKLKVLANDDPEHKIVAIEVMKYVQGDDGTTLKILPLRDGTESLIHIYHGNENQCDTEIHDKMLTVGTEGIGMFYDYDVTGGSYDNPAYVKIAEDADTVEDVLYDTFGNKWLYDRTKVDTEYVWRDFNDPALHTKEGYNKDTEGGLFYSEAEILGEYKSNYSQGYWYNGEWHDGNEFNGFLEFYIYNIYKPAGYLKINKDVTINGNAPVSEEEKKQLAGQYEFIVYTDEACEHPYNVNSGSSRVPLTLTVMIGEDGIARSSETVAVPAGTY